MSLPEELLSRIDAMAEKTERNRSAMVREAIRLYLRQSRLTEANLDRLRRGYEKMGGLNLALAEEGLAEDDPAGLAYERALGECEDD